MLKITKYTFKKLMKSYLEGKGWDSAYPIMSFNHANQRRLQKYIM